MWVGGARSVYFFCFCFSCTKHIKICENTYLCSRKTVKVTDLRESTSVVHKVMLQKKFPKVDDGCLIGLHISVGCTFIAVEVVLMFPPFVRGVLCCSAHTCVPVPPFTHLLSASIYCYLISVHLTTRALGQRYFLFLLLITHCIMTV